MRSNDDSDDDACVAARAGDVGQLEFKGVRLGALIGCSPFCSVPLAAGFWVEQRVAKAEELEAYCCLRHPRLGCLLPVARNSPSRLATVGIFCSVGKDLRTSSIFTTKPAAASPSAPWLCPKLDTGFLDILAFV